ncbi:MAG: penicillin-binding protein 2 [Deltaproteobacteria bacterium]|nr:penicillin-binding protein 2 [Deltaproteobacteria bacterium]
MRSSNFDPVSLDVLNKRLWFITLFVLVSFSLLVFKLWLLQIVNGEAYRTQSENNRIRLQKVPPPRGMIFDRNMELLVDNRPSYNLYIIPEDITDREMLIKSLHSLVGLSPALINERLGYARQHYAFKPILIKRNITRRELALIETNLFNLPGVRIQVEPQRNYIYHELASHVIGYLGEISDSQLKSGKYTGHDQGDFVGKYGIEGLWQQKLNGTKGGRQVEVDAAGRILRNLSSQAPIPGNNISITIDRELQALAESLLKDKKGAIVALDPNNGEILALVSKPAFDPNIFVGGIEKDEWGKVSSNKDYPLQNRAISGQYPPGSVFKIVIALAGLEEGIIDPEEELTCTGSFSLGNHTYGCWKKYGHGRVNFLRALQESCDVYFYKVGKRLGVDVIAKYANNFGLGSKTGFDLDYEKTGLVPTSDWKLRRFGVPWQAGETISMSIGQSFLLVTPIQMAGVISAVFNGGYIYQPKIIKQVGMDENTYDSSPVIRNKLKAKPENLALIKRALSGVVNAPHGTGSRARIEGVEVAGKTGTAQVIALDAEKSLGKDQEIPEEFRDHAWFVAIGPVEDPKLALAILIEHGGHGGSAAAPIAKELIEKYLKIAG